MAENLYEGMFVLDSGQFAADPDGMTQMVTDLLEKAGATVVAHRPWLDGRLAYEIAGRRKGLHYLTFFQLDPTKVDALNRACRLNEKILRQLFIVQPQTLFDTLVAAQTGDHPDEVDEDVENETETVAAGDASDDES